MTNILAEFKRNAEVNEKNIPQDLKDLDQWVTWKAILDEKGNIKKIPYNPDTCAAAKAGVPETWSNYTKAYKVFCQKDYDGIGLQLNNNGIIGIDIDKCIDAAGRIDYWAQEIIDKINSYTEISPSGRGIRIIAKGALPPNGRKKDNFEIYADNRYLTITGNHLEGTPKTVNQRNQEIKEVHSSIFTQGGGSKLQEKPAPGQVSEDEILRKAFSSKNGNKIQALYNGDWSGYPSQSEADQALCNHLAFWYANDQIKIDRIFRNSGLYREKWDTKHYSDGITYGEKTIEKAISSTSAVFTAKKEEPKKADSTIEVKSNNHLEKDASEVTQAWPSPLAKEAYYGLAGKTVKKILPHTEADPAALLFSFFVMFGNVIGRYAHFVAEADKHFLNLFVCIVGATSKGRKGSAHNQIKRLFEEVDYEWARERENQGLSSGEGLIWAVRDAQLNKKKNKSGAEEEILQMEEIIDKRLLVVEAEFSSTLKVLKREGNTLSAVLRKAWDDGSLASMTKNSLAKATGAHISLISHITKAELIKCMDTTEAANGFGNRFLWVCVKRSKCLPEGGVLHDEDFSYIIKELDRAIRLGSSAGELKRDQNARSYWYEIYPELSEGKPGLLGAMIGRAEAQVMRLACIYALLDHSTTISLEHLQAAKAVWDYSEASARFIFGETLGDPVADAIYKILNACPSGLTRTEISNHLGRNRSSHEMTRALNILSERGIACAKNVLNDKKRPIEVWVKT